MNYEDEIIKELAEPIIEQLEKMQDQLSKDMIQVPEIKFVFEPTNEPLVIDGVEITDEILEKLEEYLKDEIEMMAKPTILH